MQHEIAGTLEEEQRRQTFGLIRVYNYYRVVIGTSLLVMFIQEIGDRLLGAFDPDRFFFAAAGYLLVNLIIAAGTLALPGRVFSQAAASLTIVLLDISALLFMVHYSGGVTSGLGSLIIVSVALGSIIVSGNLSTLIAAFATLGLLYEELYLSLLTDAPPPDFFQAGLLGAIFFGSTLLIRNLSGRLRSLEITNLERSLRLRNLERLNREIVQRMHTGIMVVDENGTLSMQNEAARRLMGSDPQGDSGSAPAESWEDQLLPLSVQRVYEHWLEDAAYRSEPIEAPSGALLRINFSAVDARRSDEGTIIFLEDQAELAQQAQNLKLAALGRLSASIAHEIRNPLGAISHAQQLLDESENLDKHDRRLTGIIRTHSLRMNEIIENVLQLSRRQAAVPELLELGPWIDRFLDEFRESGYAQLEAEVHVEPAGIEVRMDPRQLRQVVTNLVQNGERYSVKATGRSWVRLRAGIVAASERPFLEVVDCGPGVPEDELDQLFEPFHTTEHTGTGLGLYISRELCEANQASLTYRKADTGGAGFRVTFPHPDRQTAGIS